MLVCTVSNAISDSTVFPAKFYLDVTPKLISANKTIIIVRSTFAYFWLRSFADFQCLRLNYEKLFLSIDLRSLLLSSSLFTRNAHRNWLIFSPQPGGSNQCMWVASIAISQMDFTSNLLHFESNAFRGFKKIQYPRARFYHLSKLHFSKLFKFRNHDSSTIINS